MLKSGTMVCMRLVMGRDVRHQRCSALLTFGQGPWQRRTSFAPSHQGVNLFVKSPTPGLRVGAYPHTLKSGLPPPAGAYPHTKISVAQSYPDTHLFGILLSAKCFSSFDCSVFHLFKPKLQIMQGHPHSIHLDWRQCQQSQRQAQQSTLFSKIPSFQHIRA
jgi:hypothetical protein